MNPARGSTPVYFKALCFKALYWCQTNCPGVLRVSRRPRAHSRWFSLVKNRAGGITDGGRHSQQNSRLLALNFAEKPGFGVRPVLLDGVLRRHPCRQSDTDRRSVSALQMSRRRLPPPCSRPPPRRPPPNSCWGRWWQSKLRPGLWSRYKSCRDRPPPRVCGHPPTKLPRAIPPCWVRCWRSK